MDSVDSGNASKPACMRETLSDEVGQNHVTSHFLRYPIKLANKYNERRQKKVIDSEKETHCYKIRGIFGWMTIYDLAADFVWRP